jgi:asparagine synthase (glutamine-hydrolysing)
MCGITGFLDLSASHDDDQLTALVTRMADSIRHRGPDDSGMWVDSGAGIALGFRRLAILDLSPTGHQPMASTDGRYMIIFNGEVYNFADLRGELSARGHAFRGTSDTEIMLAAISEWGLEAAVKRFNGMFAFAVWDRQTRCLHLVRDRLGVKPLYYCRMGAVFLFGSELKALRAHPAFAAEIYREALALYLRYSYIPAPWSIYRNVSKLPPASILSLKADSPAASPQPQPYWSAREIAEQGAGGPLPQKDPELIDQLDGILRASVRERMIADVPLGAFLSGGIDSSAIVALMQAQSGRPVKTFTIGFRDSGFDEAGYARAVARHLGTEHTELYVTPEEARAVIPGLPQLYDEPFADASQIPTFLVSQLARQHVTVSLSGDGGDELFGGYNRYFWTRRIWGAVGWMPAGLRKSLGGFLAGLSGEDWQKANAALPSRRRLPNIADKASRLGEMLEAGTVEETYLNLISQWKQPETVVLEAREPLTLPRQPGQWPRLPTFTDRMMYLDLVTYLPDDILAKLDRAAMGVSLEGRVPYLDDQRVVEFAWRLPQRAKIRDGKGKWILRQVLYRYVPPKLIERPKMGFGVPIDSWLRGPLREWAETLLDAGRLQREGFLNPEPVRLKWAEHLSGKRNGQYPLWNILMFQAWLQSNS